MPLPNREIKRIQFKSPFKELGWPLTKLKQKFKLHETFTNNASFRYALYKKNGSESPRQRSIATTSCCWNHTVGAFQNENRNDLP